MEYPVIISVAVEGDLDEAIACRLIQKLGATPGRIYGKKGKQDLKNKINGYNLAAQHYPWLVIVDLDLDAECVPLVLPDWLPTPSPFMCFRMAVHTIEAWLLADQERISRFLSISRSKIPNNPESIADPKGFIVNLARQSRSRDIQKDMVPRPNSGRRIGPAYTSQLIEFVSNETHGWRPDIAILHSNSLNRAIENLKNLMQEKI
jgi:hypothetical protein